LRQYDRAPFIDVLVEWIGCGPGPDAIADFAEKHPDKYVAAVSSLARIAGFSEKTETRVDVNIDIRRLSDSQLEDKLAEFASKIGISGPRNAVLEASHATINATALEERDVVPPRNAGEEAIPKEMPLIEGEIVPNLDDVKVSAVHQPAAAPPREEDIEEEMPPGRDGALH